MSKIKDLIWKEVDRDFWISEAPKLKLSYHILRLTNGFAIDIFDNDVCVFDTEFVHFEECKRYAQENLEYRVSKLRSQYNFLGRILEEYSD